MSDVIGRGVIEVEVNDAGVEAGIAKIERSVAGIGKAAGAAGKEASAGINQIGAGSSQAASKVEQAAERVDQASKKAGRSLATLGQAAGESAKAGASVGKMGDGGDTAARKVEAATKSMVGSIQRATAAMEAGSKSGSEYYKFLANQRGIDVNTLKPYLDQLDAVSVKHAKAGTSAAQMSAAMRGLPAQITDIVVSLQSGQNPMTVLLQQGGQLKDMFGGLGPAARALGGYVAGMINPFTLTAAAIGTLAVAAYQGAQDTQDLGFALGLTNNAAGLTASSFETMAARIADSAHTGIGSAKDALLQVAGSGKLAGETLQNTAAAAELLADMTGGETADASKLLTDALTGSISSLVDMNEKFGILTASEFEHIKALREGGQEEQARFELSEKVLAQFVAVHDQNLSDVGRMWDGLLKKVSEYWNAVKGIGGPPTIDENIANAKAKISRLQTDPRFQGYGSKEIDQLRNQILGWESDKRREQTDANRDAERAATEKRKIRLSQESDQWTQSNRSREQRRQDELAAQKKYLEAGVINEETYAKRVASIREKYAEKGRKTSGYGSREDRETAGLAARIAAEKQLTSAMILQGAAYDKLTEGEKLAIKYRYEAGVTTKDAAKAHKESLAKMADQLGYQQALNKAIQERLKVSASLDDRDRKRAFDLQLETEEVEKQLQFMGMTEKARAVAQAQWEVEKASKQELFELDKLLAEATKDQILAEEALAKAMETGSAKAIEAARKVVEERNRVVADVQGEKTQVVLAEGVRKQNAASAAAANYAMEEWKHTSQEIERALTDALMRGFESGKGFGENLADTLKNMFGSLVLRPMIQAVVQPVANEISGWYAQASGGGGGERGGGAGADPSTLYSVGEKVYNWWNGGAAAGAGATGSAGSAAGSQAAGDWMMAQNSQTGFQAGATGGPQVAGWQMAGASIVGSFVGNAAAAKWGRQTPSGQRAGSYGAAAGAAAGAKVGAAWGGVGALVGAVIGGIVGGVGGSKLFGHGGPKEGGNYNASYSNSGQLLQDQFFGGYTPNQHDGELKDIVSGLRDRYQELVTELGGTSRDLTINLGYDMDPQGSAGNRVSAQLAMSRQPVGLDGGTAERDLWSKSLLDWRSFAADNLQQKMTEATGKMLLLALQHSGIQEEYAKVLEGKDIANMDDNALENLTQELLYRKQLNDAFKDLSKVMPSLSGLTFDLKDRFVGLFGGMQNLNAALGSFYSNFYSSEEQRDRLVKQLQEQFDTVNLKLPAVDSDQARAEFRKLAESLDKTTDAGQKAFAVMMATSEAFASITKSVDEAAAAAKQRQDEAVAAARQRLEDARGRVQEAYERESRAKEELIERLRSYVNGLQQFKRQLVLGDLSTLSPKAKYDEARQQFNDVKARALAGDEEAQGQFTEVLQSFLEASQAYYATTSAQYAADFAEGQAALAVLEASATSQISVAQSQLGELQKMVTGILDVNKSVLSLTDAVRQFLNVKVSTGIIEGGNGTIYSNLNGFVTGTDGRTYTVDEGRFGIETAGNLVYRAYRDILGRDADEGGRVFWENAISNGTFGQGDIDTDRFIKEFTTAALGAGADKEKTEEWLKLHGSHRDGLEYVPFDGYRAELHRGERVLTAAENFDYSRYSRPDNTALVAELRALREEVARLQEVVDRNGEADRAQRGDIAHEQLKQGGEQIKTLQRQAGNI